MHWPEELTETPDLHGAYPRLSRARIERLAARGERRPLSRDDVLFTEGELTDDFFVVLDGKVAMVEEYGTADRVDGLHGPGRFLGEMNVLSGLAGHRTAVCAESGEVLAVPVDELRRMIGRDAAMGDLILRAFVIRRSMITGLGTGLRIVGSRFSADTRRLREFAVRNRLPHKWIDLEEDWETECFLRAMGVMPEETPVVILRCETVLRNPSNAELAGAVSLPAPRTWETVCDLLVVGAGPAGLAAAVYGAADGLSTIVVDGGAIGGQARTSPRIESHLGFPYGISGDELVDRAMTQATGLGACFRVPAEAAALDGSCGDHVVTTRDGTVIHSRALIVATGIRYRRLQLPDMDRFERTSVYYAATMFEARECRRDPIVVVGGGDTAGQAALFLAAHAAWVRLLAREGDLRVNMSRYLAVEVERDPRIQVMLNTEVRELTGGKMLEAVVAEDNVTGERSSIEARALFVLIGAEPHTPWLSGEISLDRRGYILTGARAVRFQTTAEGRAPGRPFPLETSRPGVFAAGDVRSGSTKRVVSAAGEGAMAARLVHEHLRSSF
ncbi:FAD-dependent oxidoreductase [Sphaerimonospora sp. CA-214678]|uniref:FAD-dependent oxidoreductase n=1 Tax=Sphaerimonospora sp. CA-214678 TaxID=3240029 RepID=UPI003D8E891E